MNHYTSKQPSKRHPKVQRTCEYCHNVFMALFAKVKIGEAKFCSRKCFHAYRGVAMTGGNHPRWKGGEPVQVCEFCGIEFKAQASRVRQGKGRYCSNECKGISQRVQVECICDSCNKYFYVNPSKTKKGDGRFCSRECMGKTFAIENRGENSHLWRGGHKKYRGENWLAQRRLAYARDEGTCQYCGKKHQIGQRKFPVHHIKPFREFNGDFVVANQLTNLITLCHYCHSQAEFGKISIQPRLF